MRAKTFSLALSLLVTVPATQATAGDPARGETLYRQCIACHVLEPGVNRVGPSLAGVFGRTAGTVEGFRYSPAMVNSGIVWDEETIAAYLEAPRTFIPGNRMAYAGMRNPQDRDDLIAYLKEATQ